MGQKTTAQALREQLMAPSAIDRVHALHALELALENAPTCPIAKELAAFTARGIPYYAPEDAHYCEWVAQAVKYLEKLQAEEARALGPPGCSHGRPHGCPQDPRKHARDRPPQPPGSGGRQGRAPGLTRPWKNRRSRPAGAQQMRALPSA
ncbi:MAG: hypothetical protein QM742_08895 [Aquabacterium sp.]